MQVDTIALVFEMLPRCADQQLHMISLISAKYAALRQNVLVRYGLGNYRDLVNNLPPFYSKKRTLDYVRFCSVLKRMSQQFA